MNSTAPFMRLILPALKVNAATLSTTSSNCAASQLTATQALTAASIVRGRGTKVKSSKHSKKHKQAKQQKKRRLNRTPKPKPAHIITGRWSKEEHEHFMNGLAQYGKEWKKVARLIRTRTIVQIRTHAQKYFQKLRKQAQQPNTKLGVANVLTTVSQEKTERDVTKRKRPTKGESPTSPITTTTTTTTITPPRSPSKRSKQPGNHHFESTTTPTRTHHKKLEIISQKDVNTNCPKNGNFHSLSNAFQQSEKLFFGSKEPQTLSDQILNPKQKPKSKKKTKTTKLAKLKLKKSVTANVTANVTAFAKNEDTSRIFELHEWFSEDWENTGDDTSPAISDTDSESFDPRNFFTDGQDDALDFPGLLDDLDQVE